MAGNITIATANPPEGTCPAWLITKWAQLVSLITANLNGAQNTFNYGNAVPAPADQNKPWIRTNSDGSPDKTYIFFGGLWVARHSLLPGARIIAPSSLVNAAQVWAWDGGDGSDPATTPPAGAVGAMWEIDPDLTARFPLGAGVSPAPYATNFAVNTQGGEEKHIQTVSELAAHHHTVEVIQDDTSGSGGHRLRPDPTGTDAITQDVGGSQPSNLMPLYNVVLFLRRTNRVFLTP